MARNTWGNVSAIKASPISARSRRPTSTLKGCTASALEESVAARS